jgi:hypothetical protein
MTTPVLKTYKKKFTSDAHGRVRLTGAGALDIKEFSQADLEIVNFPNPLPNLMVSVYMGKISGWTLAQVVETFPLSGSTVIHTYPVIGPEMTVWVLGAPPNTDVEIQAWVLLH